MLILIVAGGPDKGRMYELSEEQPVIIGREGDRIRLNDRKASRKHARLWSEGGKWYVRDLGSRHGTHLNAEEVEGQRELSDGDHIQIGRTLFVLSRMTPETAERLALLGPAGEAGTRGAAGHGPIGYVGRHPRLVLGGAAAAAALLIGSNAALYVSSTRQTRSTQQLLAKVQHLDDTRTGAANADPMLRKILAAVQTQHDQGELLEQIRDALAHQPDNAKLLKSLLAKVDKLDLQAGDQAVLHEVQALAEATQKQQQALAENAQANGNLMRETLAEVRSRPGVEQIAQYVQKATQSQATDNAKLLKQVLANLDQQKDLAGQIEALRNLVEQQPEQTQAAMRKIAQDLASADNAKVLTAIDQIRHLLPDDVSAKLDQVLAKLNHAGSPKDIAAAVKSVIDQQQDPTAKALARIADRLEAQPTAKELLAAIDKAVANPDAALVAKLDKLAGQLDQAMAKAAQASNGQPSDAVTEQLAQQQQQTQKLLKSVLAQVRNHQPLDELRTQIEQLAKAGNTQGNHTQPNPMLARILAQLKDHGSEDARLARLENMIETWPRQTRAMLEQMAGAMQRAQGQPDSEAVRKALRDIRAKALARVDALGDALRHDLQLKPGETAGKAALASTSGEADTATQVAAPRGTRDGAVLMSPRKNETQTVSVDNAATNAPKLSRTQQAYKLAFETGQPVTIGVGTVNPVTGEVSEGRTLDPAAAKAAGIKTWREWYLMDDFAERMRLQRQAMRYSAKSKDADLITLPPSTGNLAGAVVADASSADAPSGK